MANTNAAIGIVTMIMTVTGAVNGDEIEIGSGTVPIVVMTTTAIMGTMADTGDTTINMK